MEQDLGVMLATLLRAYHEAVTPRLQDVPHGPRGYQTLREVAEGTQPSQVALATHLGIDRTVMTYLIDDLTEAGLVERRANPTDRRQRQVVATDEGARAVAEACRQARAVEDAVLSGLTTAERTQLRALLARAAASAAGREPLDPCEVVEGLEASAPAQARH